MLHWGLTPVPTMVMLHQGLMPVPTMVMLHEGLMLIPTASREGNVGGKAQLCTGTFFFQIQQYAKPQVPTGATKHVLSLVRNQYFERYRPFDLRKSTK